MVLPVNVGVTSVQECEDNCFISLILLSHFLHYNTVCTVLYKGSRISKSIRYILVHFIYYSSRSIEKPLLCLAKVTLANLTRVSRNCGTKLQFSQTNRQLFKIQKVKKYTCLFCEIWCGSGLDPMYYVFFAGQKKFKVRGFQTFLKACKKRRQKSTFF